MACGTAWICNVNVPVLVEAVAIVVAAVGADAGRDGHDGIDGHDDG